GTETNNSFATNVSFGTTFGAAPNVQVSVGGLLAGSFRVIYGIDSVTTSACSSYISFIGVPTAGGPEAIMNVRSEGTVSL
ncbi:hypothetical protein LCGC14_2923620, partial [marine sediment metagenome]